MDTHKYTTPVRRVYFAAPITICPTARHDRLLAHARASFPDSELLSARELFADNADWRARWPDILRTLSAVVFIADPDGWIGAGVWREVHDAGAAGLPVFHLADDGSMRPLEAVRFDPIDGGSPRYYRRLVRRPTKRRAGRRSVRKGVH